jgi:hypothetical protein
MVKRGTKVAAILIVVAGFLMVLSDFYQIWQLYFGVLQGFPAKGRHLETIIHAAEAFIGGVDVAVGMAILARKPWALRAMLLWAFISALVFVVGTWASKFYFDWQLLSYSYRAGVILFYLAVGYLLWTLRRIPNEA